MSVPILYAAGFLLGAIMATIILQATRFHEIFKQGKTYQIILAHILVAIIAGHVVGEIFYRIQSFF